MKNFKNQHHDFRVNNGKNDKLIKVKFRNCELSFLEPSTTAMLLDHSYVMWFTSQNSLIESKFIKNKALNIFIDNDKKEFDFLYILEQKMSAIIFAYTAIESFANESIPDDFIYKNERQDKKCIEQFTKIQIERFVSLDIKLGEILPQIIKVDSPKSTSIWQSYLNLKKIRDSIIHCKSSINNSDNEIWNELLSENIKNPCLEAKKVIGYFVSELDLDKQPAWYKNFYKDELETPVEFFNSV
jgi:hypothetical protein